MSSNEKMADVSKNDIHAIFKRLRSIPTNKSCFDCNSKNSTWASVTYGVFLCIDCSAVHRSLGVHVTFIRSTQLDSWTWPQLRAMQVGGNANATVFFRQHGTSTSDANTKYHSRAAQLYKEKIKTLAAAAMRKYGTDSPHIGDHAVSSPETKEVDFFKEHVDNPSNSAPAVNYPSQLDMNLSSSPSEAEVKVQAVPIKNGQEAGGEGDTREPSVDHVLGTSPSQSMAKVEPRKSTIGQRKPMSGKKGLGAKKKLGAQKVTTNFADIESAAHQADLMKKETVVKTKKTKEEEESSMASMRLAYQDMSVERKKQEERMKSANPQKAEQMERLGMGFGGRSAVSHSAMSDMQTIKQDTPSSSTKTQRSSSRDFFDDFDTGSSGFSSRNKDSLGYSSRKDRDDDNERDDWEMVDKPKQSEGYDSIKPLEDRMSSSKKKSYEAASTSTEAQKRFSNAKSISSDAYFGKSDMDDTTRANLDRMSGKSSISSAELYGDQSASGSSYNAGTDMSAIKDGMKDSVTQVAGRLSRMANGIVSSIQDRYGY